MPITLTARSTISIDHLAARGVSWRDRKSTRLNSSHVEISYAVFCLKKKNNHSHSTIPKEDNFVKVGLKFPPALPTLVDVEDQMCTNLLRFPYPSELPNTLSSKALVE